MWNWFLANGDKALNSIAVALLALQQSGAIPQTWAPAVAVVLSLIHQVAAPEAPAPAPKSS